MICHGCKGTGKIKKAGGTDEVECVVCDGAGSLPDTYSIEIAQTRPDLCPACGRDRSEPPLDSCPKSKHYAEFCGFRVDLPEKSSTGGS